MGRSTQHCYVGGPLEVTMWAPTVLHLRAYREPTEPQGSLTALAPGSGLVGIGF